MSKIALSVRDLKVNYGAIQAVKGIDLEVHEGSVVALLGANGAGNTTLLRAISGIYRGTVGSIRFKGTEILNQPSHRSVDLGLLQAPEGRQIFSSMTVGENLALGGGPRGRSARR